VFGVAKCLDTGKRRVMVCLGVMGRMVMDPPLKRRNRGSLYPVVLRVRAEEFDECDVGPAAYPHFDKAITAQPLAATELQKGSCRRGSHGCRGITSRQSRKGF
jgi:hypothetical protein